MKWIVITLPDFIENESTYINQLFKTGIDLLHLRKPESNIEECKRLIQEIDKKWHKKIVVHDHFELCRNFIFMVFILTEETTRFQKAFKEASHNPAIVLRK